MKLLKTICAILLITLFILNVTTYAENDISYKNVKIACSDIPTEPLALLKEDNSLWITGGQPSFYTSNGVVDNKFYYKNFQSLKQ